MINYFKPSSHPWNLSLLYLSLNVLHLLIFYLEFYFALIFISKFGGLLLLVLSLSNFGIILSLYHLKNVKAYFFSMLWNSLMIKLAILCKFGRFHLWYYMGLVLLGGNSMTPFLIFIWQLSLFSFSEDFEDLSDTMWPVLVKSFKNWNI